MKFLLKKIQKKISLNNDISKNQYNNYVSDNYVSDVI